MNWYNFYKDRLNISYNKHIEKKYSLFIKEIEKLINPNSTILEMGSGIGSITKILNKRKKGNFLISDINKNMLKLSNQNLKSIPSFIFDIKNHLYKKVDIIHCHGVLEHFDNTDIQKIIKNQLKSCTHLIHYVPSNKYKIQSFGDERLLSKEEWFNLIKPKEIIAFNNNYDLILKW
ncbi:MAG: hypothetical protein B6I28_01270 [Fusobacteriia bacterium 4572_132]|nr:MAG: hypothetical protein B6I28_01270 [Fusobacteriia bacterium 4572_132]